MAVVLGVLLAVGADDADHAVVEVHAVVRVDRAHVVGAVDVGVAGDQLDVLAVLRAPRRRRAASENLANSTASRPRLLDLLALLLVDAAADAAGQAPVGMHGAAADHLDQVVAVAAHLEHLAGDVHADLLHHAEDVALGGRGGGADDEVRPAQGVEVRGVVGGEEDAVEQLAELLGRRRRIDVEQGVQGLGGRHVVGLGTDAADAGRQVGHVLGRPAHAELLEAAQLRNLQVGVGHVPLVVRKMSILPWPSSRVTGSMDMRFIG